MATRQRVRRRGVTLMEVVVVFALLGVLAGLLLVAVQKARETTQRATCMNNLRQLGVAAHGYHDGYGTLPPYAPTLPGRPKLASWVTPLLPYLGYEGVFRQIQAPGRLPEETRAAKFSVLLCPSDPSVGDEQKREPGARTNYVANWYALTDGRSGFYAPARQLGDLKDGPSHVVLFAETYSACDRVVRSALFSPLFHNFGVTQEGKPSDDPSYLPADYTMFQVQPRRDGGPNSCHRLRTQTPHPVMHVTLADGSVRPIHANISPETWGRALKPCDGQPLGEDW